MRSRVAPRWNSSWRHFRQSSRRCRGLLPASDARQGGWDLADARLPGADSLRERRTNARACRSERRWDHASSSPHKALLRDGTQRIYGSDGVAWLGLAHQGRCQVLAPPHPWRPGYRAVRDGAEPTLTNTQCTVMLQPAGGQQKHAARHHSASAKDKKQMGGDTCEKPRRDSNPSPGRSTGRDLEPSRAI